MSIDFDNVELLTLAKAARLLPPVRGDKTLHPSTLMRWATVGIKAASGRIIKLKSVFVGGTRMTSRAWMKEFQAARNDMEYQPLPETAEQEEKLLEEQAAEALRRMRSSGLIDAGQARDPKEDYQREDDLPDDEDDFPDDDPGCVTPVN